jgi:hypothetical protein
VSTFQRGPAKYGSQGSGTVGATGRVNYLNGCLSSNTDPLPRLSWALPDEGPRQIGWAWAAPGFPGPYQPSGAHSNAWGLTSVGASMTVTDAAIGTGIGLGGVTTWTTNALAGAQAGFASAAEIQVTAGRRIWFHVRLLTSNAANGNWLLGLVDAVPADLTVGAFGNVANGIYIFKAATATQSSFNITKTTNTQITNIDTAATVPGGAVLANNTAVEYGFLVDAAQPPTAGPPNIVGAGAISCYVNGFFAGSFASTASNIPTAALKFALVRQATAGGVATTMSVFQCLCAMELLSGD